MKTYSISQLARFFGLSRSTLLYYDQIGLVSASGRTAAGYRVYSLADRRRLEKICQFRQTGLSLSEISKLMQGASSPKGFTAILKERLSEIGGQILELKKQQRLIVALLKKAGKGIRMVDKALWIEMMRGAGLDEEGMARWHAEFERRSPEGHQEFLCSLGLASEEVQSIRQWSAGK